MNAVLLEGESLRLRPWRDSDLEGLAALRNDAPLQAQLMARAQPNSPERVREWLRDRELKPDMLLFVAASRDEDDVLGYVQVASVDMFHGIGELGICFPPIHQGRGFAQEACRLLDSHLAQTLGLRKLVLRVLADNPRAISFYLKCGYREVGRMLHHHRTDAGMVDVVYMERFIQA